MISINRLSKKFLAFTESGQDVTQAFFASNTLQAELSLALNDKFILSDFYKKYDSGGGIADSIARAQQEFNLFIDNSKLPGILATIINKGSTVDRINYNFYQKLTAYHPPDNRHLTQPREYIPSATLNRPLFLFVDPRQNPGFYGWLCPKCRSINIEGLLYKSE